MAVVFSGPGMVVNGPVPSPPRYSLLAAANIVDVAQIGVGPEIDGHWQGGVNVWPFPPDDAYTWDVCSSGTYRPKQDGGTIPLPQFGAFVAYLAETCTTRSVAGMTQEQYVQRAMTAFAAAEANAVEAEFARGIALPGNPHLADASCTILNSGTATNARAGLSFLEDAIGGTGRAGMIHATPGTVAGWSWGEGRVYAEGGRLQTLQGTPIAAGGGYLGAAPEPHTAPGTGTAWAWATGPVNILRSEVILTPGTVKEAMDRGTNTITYRVERVYVVEWDTVLQSAVLIDWTTL